MPKNNKYTIYTTTKIVLNKKEKWLQDINVIQILFLQAKKWIWKATKFYEKGPQGTGFIVYSL